MLNRFVPPVLRLRGVAFAAALALGAFAIAPPASQAEPIRLPRHPVITPDATAVVFRHGGDLWRVDDPLADGPRRAVRLTSHTAFDDHPVISPGGTWVAFSSARDGQAASDVWIVPLVGGTPRRLTWDSSSDVPLAFSPDGRHVYFRSGRRPRYPDRASIYRQDVSEPREPALVLDHDVTDLAVTPDGTLRIALRGTQAWRKDYTGAAATDIFEVRSDGGYRQVTDTRFRDRWPLGTPDPWTVWVSGRDGTDNLWSHGRDGGPESAVQRTRFEEYGVRNPALATEALVAVFEQGDGLFTLDLKSRVAEPVRIEIDVVSDRVVAPVARRRVRAASEVVPNPKGDVIAFVAHGEIYVRRVKDGVAVRLTNSPARDEWPIWTPDGKALLFVSDRAGSRDLYRIRSADGEDPRLHRATAHTIEAVVQSPTRETAPTLSPDGKRLAFIRGLGDLMLLDLETEGADPEVLLSGWSQPRFSFSPDGAWIAYSREDEDFNTDVWLLELGTGRKVNVSQHPDSDYGPAWSPDGRKLAFVSERTGDERDVYLVYLREEDHEATKQDLADAAEDLAQQAKGGKAKPKAKPGDGSGEDKDEDKDKDGDEPDGAAKEPANAVEVDPDLWRRVRRVKPLIGSQDWVGFTHDSKRLLFRSDHLDQADLYSTSLAGSDLKRLTTGVNPRNFELRPQAKALFFLRAGTIPAKVGEAGGAVATFAVDVRLDHPVRDERAQVFDEAWRTMRDRWYDASFKGYDWEALGRRYRELALSVPTHVEFHEVLRMLLGELRGSHLGVWGGGPADAAPYESAPGTAHLGVDLQPGADGWVVTAVLKDGPCDRARSRLEVGDRILSIEGAPLGAGTVLAHRLEGRIGERTVLAVQRVGVASDQPRERVTVRPGSTRTLRSLWYERWTEQVRAIVEGGTAGRVGYVHIQGMNVPSLERFEAELYARGNGKDALVIDVRNNGGGWTADFLLAILAAPEHAFTVPRGGGRGYPEGRRPLAAWTKPVVVLCNEKSFSNAEIFSHAIKTTGRGVLVGRETAGGVISTGAHRLLDGSTLRLPFRGWYVRGTGADMDKGGAVPHVPVDNVPGEGRDRQAEAAVREALEAISH